MTVLTQFSVGAFVTIWLLQLFGKTTRLSVAALVSLLVAGLVLLAAFVLVEQRVRHPLLPCFIDTNNAAKPVMKYGEALAGVKILARLLRPLLKDDPMVGLWIPPSAGGARVSLPGGCAWGPRPVNLHLTGLAAMMNVVQSPQVQPLSGMGLELGKSEQALAELRAQDLAD